MCLIYLARASGLPWGVSETSSLFWGPRYLLPSESFPTPIYGIGWRSGGLSAIATPRGGGLGPGLSAADGHSLKQHVAQAKHVASGGRGGCSVLGDWVMSAPAPVARQMGKAGRRGLCAWEAASSSAMC